MDTKTYTVLVVEDEKLLLEAIVKKLKLNGLSVIASPSGKEALKILEQSEKVPDVIWLDYYLKDMNGIEFMNALRKNSKLHSIPTIVVSNSASEDKVSNMLGLGVKKYYLKAENRLDQIIDHMKEFVHKENT